MRGRSGEGCRVFCELVLVRLGDGVGGLTWWFWTLKLSFNLIGTHDKPYNYHGKKKKHQILTILYLLTLAFFFFLINKHLFYSSVSQKSSTQCVEEASFSSETLQENLFPCLIQLQAAAAAAKSHQSCPTLCDPIDSSPPGSPVPGILQARKLEWVAISFSWH